LADEYQVGFAALSPAMFDPEGRRQKAEKVLAVVEDYVRDPSRLTLLDLGCSTGFMTRTYAERFGSVVGVDIDADAIRYATAHNAAPNIRYFVRDAMDTGLPGSSFDVATCTQIYEHVPDAGRLMDEIHRVLTPGGICFFSANNRIMAMEPHYRLPFLSLLPHTLANAYVRLTGRGSRYFETHRTVWGLRALVRNFEIIDYTRRVIQEPERFHATDLVCSGSVKQRLGVAVARYAYGLCPTYLWLLRKPTGG